MSEHNFEIPSDPVAVEEELLHASAIIARCGEIYGEAVKAETIAEAGIKAEESMYRAWQAKYILDVVNKAEKKPTESVLTAMYRADPAHLVHKQRIGQANAILGEAQEKVKAAMGRYNAALRKHETLLALWRRFNQEMDAHNFINSREETKDKDAVPKRKPM